MSEPDALKTTPPEPADEGDAAARRIYTEATNNDPHIHCNRFPPWDELSEKTRDYWRGKVPTTPENSELVTQADRDAAAALLDRIGGTQRFEKFGVSFAAIDNAFCGALARHRIEATRTAQATPAADIVLVSAGFGEDGYQLHGLFAHFEGALAHVRKDEADEQIRWQNHADDRRFVVCGEVQWVASRQPIRARTSDPIHAEGEGYD